MCMFVRALSRRDKRIDNWRDFQTEPEAKKLKVQFYYIRTTYIRTYLYVLAGCVLQGRAAGRHQAWSGEARDVEEAVEVTSLPAALP